MRWTDIHAHLLPGIDDGAQSVAESIEMLELAREGGSGGLVATPHMFRPNLGCDDAAEVRAAFDRWRAELAAHDDPTLPEVHLGAENYVSSEFAEALAAGEVVPLAGSRYLLIEFWPMILAGAARNAVAAVRDAGFVPIVAHVERYHHLHEEPDLLAQLLDAGAVAQVNATAVLGHQGVRVARLTDRWLRAGWVSIVASDGHGIHLRRPDLAAVAGFLDDRFTGELAELCLATNPAAVVGDRLLSPVEPTTARRWWWRRRKSSRAGG